MNLGERSVLVDDGVIQTDKPPGANPRRSRSGPRHRICCCGRFMKSKSEDTMCLEGKVVAFNTSPRGARESVLLRVKKQLVQVTYPKERAPSLSEIEIGSELRVDVRAGDAHGDHPVYDAVEEEAEAEGKVVRLNYARHGELNGFHLDDGTFVHLKPEGARKRNVRVGQRVTIRGRRIVGPDAVVVEP